MVCPNCGAQSQGAGIFCAECGTRLPESAPPPAVEEVAAPPVAAVETAASQEPAVTEAPASPEWAAVPTPPAPAVQPVSATPAWSQAAPPPPQSAPQPSAPPAPPAWSQAAPPPPPAQPAAPPAWSQAAPPPAWSQAAPPPPQPPAPPSGAPAYGAPLYGQPQYGAQQYAAIPAKAPAGTNTLGALLAAVGGLIAIATAWLPWVTQSGTTFNGIDATDTSTLACGYYLLAGGAIAAVCGLLLMMRLGRGSGLHLLFALGAIVGGVFVVAVDVAAYGNVNDLINGPSGFGVDSGFAVGYGIYAGIGAGVAAALGGVMVLLGRR